MRCIVTGGAGFIGSNLVEALLNLKYEIIIIDNFSTGRIDNIREFKSKIKIVNADISKKGAWVKLFNGVNVVFHLAALADIVPSIINPQSYFDSNVIGTMNVVEACKKNSVKKLIYSASSSCYGIPKKFPTNEKEKINPEYPYALTKYLGEQIVMHWGKVYNIEVVSLRFFNVYGLKSRTSGTYGAVFGVFLAQKFSSKPFTVVGDGRQTRDFTYISDVVSSIISASSSDIKNEIINIGSSRTYSINKLVKYLGGEKIHIPKRPSEPDCTWADINKAAKLLNWKPKITLKQGVNILLDNIKYWGKAPVWTPKKISKATEEWFHYLDDK
jgi:UDP-glucose 4-epimerase